MAGGVEFSPELFNTICERIAEGETLSDICAAPDMPSRRSFYDWKDATPERASQYARAREALADLEFDKTAKIIDACTPESAAADRVKLNGRQWRAMILDRRRFGEKVAVGGDPGNPLTVIQTIERRIVQPKRESEE